jgi:thioesterase domain-containing protein/2-polyprenyl-3-methyl-5-hydroxy-6-metoxy-1,4-benzoquinol methylase
VPVGVAGELYIGGAGVARGYLNLPKLTAEKFLADPFATEPGDRIYRSGDRGRWLPDGTIEFLGRNDFQVKIRGYRIELGEIEAQLEEHRAVREAVVVAREDSSEGRRLVAYYVPRDSGSSDGQAELWPSIGEYSAAYDDLIYYGLTGDQKRKEFYQRTFDAAIAGKTILDVGTGADAILAMQCIEAGARKVYAVELLPEVADAAAAKVIEKRLEGRISVIKGDIRTVQVPEPVDAIVSEIVESIAGAEGAAVLLNAARRFLKPGGTIIPARCRTRIAALTLPANILREPTFTAISGHYVERIFQSYGRNFDLRLCIKNLSLENLISTQADFEVLDFNSFCVVDASKTIRLEIQQDAILHGFALWLVLHMGAERILDTMQEKTAWFPAVFPVFYPGIHVGKGDRIEAICQVSLSADGVHPDYGISGELISRTSGNRKFQFRSNYQDQGYRESEFYKRLFGNDDIPIRETASSTAAQLREHLSAKLPDYMVPAAYVPMKKLPLTPNGKLDRRALPAPDTGSYAARSYEMPKGEIETALAQIWASVLKLDRVGRHDNFFELGGHSLLAIRVVAHLKQALNVDMAIGDLFAHPELADLAQVLKSAAKIELPGSAAASSIDSRAVLGQISPDEAVLIRRSISGHPLFVTHEGTGSFLYINGLMPYLDDDIPVYGLPPRPPEYAPLHTVEAMAKRMVTMIRFVQPVGPYRILGWSFGGILAYEIAAQLVAASEDVAFVGLIDTAYLPGLEIPRPQPALVFDEKEELLRSIQSAIKKSDDWQAKIAALTQTCAKGNFDNFVQTAREMSVLPKQYTSATTSDIRSHLAFLHSIALAYCQYSAKQLSIRVHLFRAEQSNGAVSALGWDVVMPSDLLSIVPISGDHHSFLEAPHAEKLARTLSNAMRDVRSSSAAST